MQICRYAEQGSIELLWISATNPAVSLPDLARDPRGSSRDGAVRRRAGPLPDRDRRARRRRAARPPTWGEKTGTFTNADRTVHLSEQAVEPPGEARADLDIFLDYARAWTSATGTAHPLIKWSDAGGGVRGLEGLLARAARATTPA